MHILTNNIIYKAIKRQLWWGKMVMMDEILYIKTKQVYEVYMIDRYLEFQTFETPVPERKGQAVKSFT